MDVLPLGTYDGLDIVCLRVSTDGRTDIKLEGLLLGFSLGSVDGNEIIFKEVTETEFLIRYCLAQRLENWMDLRLVNIIL